MTEFDVTKHVLVPKHTKITDKELKELFEKYSLKLDDLPKINKADPAIAHLNLQDGDVVKVVRKSPTAGTSVFYRQVI